MDFSGVCQEIRGSKFHSVDMIRDPSGVDLEVLLFF